MHVKKRVGSEIGFCLGGWKITDGGNFQGGRKKILLVNMYAPNEAQYKFYLELKNRLIQRSGQKICIMGGLQCNRQQRICQRQLEMRRKEQEI